jgi:hypothetical protein
MSIEFAKRSLAKMTQNRNSVEKLLGQANK